MSRRPRRRLAVVAFLVAALLGMAVLALPLWVAPALVPAALTYAPNSSRARLPPEPSAETLRSAGVAKALRVPVGPPAAELSVWILEPTSREGSPDPPPTILVLHGIRDSKLSMLGWGKRLSEAGYRVVLPDLRGQGFSSGRFLTYGVLERRDLQQLLDTLLERGLVSLPVGVFGASYGGATAIEFAGVDPRVEAVVSVAPFAELGAVVPGYLRRYLPLLWRLVPSRALERAIDEAGRQANFDPDQASPRLLVRKTRAQVLLLHGAKDQHIPPWHSRKIRDAAPQRVELTILPGLDHVSIMSDRQGIVGQLSLQWFQRWLVPGRPRATSPRLRDTGPR